MDNPVIDAAIADCAEHHARSKTFSGSFTELHIEPVLRMIQKARAHTLLDYGCGKGIVYETWRSKTHLPLEHYWSIEVTKFDPAWPPFAQRPFGSFDIVLCSQVLCWVPPIAREDVLRDVFSFANDAVYIAEQLGPVKKQVVGGQMWWRDYGRDDWLALIKKVSVDFPLVDWRMAFVTKTEKNSVVDGTGIGLGA